MDNMLISAVIPKEWNDRRRKLQLSWREVISAGITSIEDSEVYAKLYNEYTMLKKRYDKVKMYMLKYDMGVLEDDNDKC